MKEAALETERVEETPGPRYEAARCRRSLLVFLASMAFGLLAIVDMRRFFLVDLGEWLFISPVEGPGARMMVPMKYLVAQMIFAEHGVRTPFFTFTFYHPLILTVAVAGMVLSYASLCKYESKVEDASLERYVKVMTFAIFGLLAAGLLANRVIPAMRATAAGKLEAGWLNAFGFTGWLRPVGLAVSYFLNVWDATFFGILFAGLALATLSRYVAPFLAHKGLAGSFFGSLFALPQPFCSCCASAIFPSLVQRGASKSFALAFLVGSPMLNITSLVLAASLLPTPYAITRIGAGILLAIPVTYLVTRIEDLLVRARGGDRARDLTRTSAWRDGYPALAEIERLVTRYITFPILALLTRYCELFHLEEIVKERKVDPPSNFIATWLYASLRIALLLVPILFLSAIVASAVVQMIPTASGNSFGGVLLASLGGALMFIPTWSEFPIAQQMIDAGLSGPAAALLVTLPPVSLPCLIVLGGALGKFRIVALLFLAVVTAGIVTGLIFL